MAESALRRLREYETSTAKLDNFVGAGRPVAVVCFRNFSAGKDACYWCKVFAPQLESYISQYGSKVQVVIVCNPRSVLGNRPEGFPHTYLFKSNGELHCEVIGTDAVSLVTHTRELLAEKTATDDYRQGYVYHISSGKQRYVGESADKQGVEARWAREASSRGHNVTLQDMLAGNHQVRAATLASMLHLH